MSDPRAFRLKSINQIGFVVKDLDSTMDAYWRHFGIGTWRVYTYGPPLVKQTTYRGRPEDFHMRIGVAEVGNLVFELIQPLDGDSLYKEFLQSAGDGVQHLGLFVDDFDQGIADAAAAGFPVIQSGRGYGVRGDGGFAYLDTQQKLGTILELLEIPSQRTPPEGYYPPDRK
jgi:methylmalonyl-CoA/ethylmalonyl-CoA epimerase